MRPNGRNNEGMCRGRLYLRNVAYKQGSPLGRAGWNDGGAGGGAKLTLKL